MKSNSKLVILIFLLMVSVIWSCTHESNEIETINTDDEILRNTLGTHSPNNDYRYYIMPESNEYDKLPNQDPTNPINQYKVELGRMLFHETGIGLKPMHASSIQSYSCSSCHVAENSFTPGRFQGIADGAVGFGTHGENRVVRELYDGTLVDAQGARPLPTINLTYVKNALWNGGFGAKGLNVGTEAVWGVADPRTDINHKGFEGLESNNHRALIVHRQHIDKEVCDKLGYTTLFDKAFPELHDSVRYNLQTGGNAIAAYFRTILTNQAPFQNWLKGKDNAISYHQKKGLELFIGKAGCINCHNSPSFNGQRFSAVGVNDLDQSGYTVFKTNDGRNLGRGGFTLKETDNFKFKVPQLYNLKDFGFYFHGSSKTNVKDVVKYFNKGIKENNRVPESQIDPLFKPLNLTESEVDALTDFIENALRDLYVGRYKPSHVLSGNCFPNNDEKSKIDLRCD